jgi:hypothetical protein
MRDIGDTDWPQKHDLSSISNYINHNRSYN